MSYNKKCLTKKGAAMKNLILPIIITFVFIIGLNAKDRISKTERSRDYISAVDSTDASGSSLFTTNELKEGLSLTDSQVPVVDSILTRATGKLTGVTETGMEGQQAKTQIINDAYNDIKKVLTDAQVSKFELMISQKSSQAPKSQY